jgi:hypothetical protein
MPLFLAAHLWARSFLPFPRPPAISGPGIRVQGEVITAHLATKSIAHVVGHGAAGQGRVQCLLLGGRKLFRSYAAKDAAIHLFGRKPNCMDEIIR